MKGRSAVKVIAELCGVGACPAIYETEQGTYLIVGRTLSGQETEALLPRRVGENEVAVEVPSELVARLKST